MNLKCTFWGPESGVSALSALSALSSDSISWVDVAVKDPNNMGHINYLGVSYGHTVI